MHGSAADSDWWCRDRRWPGQAQPRRTSSPTHMASFNTIPTEIATAIANALHPSAIDSFTATSHFLHRVSSQSVLTQHRARKQAYQNIVIDQHRAFTHMSSLILRLTSEPEITWYVRRVSVRQWRSSLNTTQPRATITAPIAQQILNPSSAKMEGVTNHLRQLKPVQCHLPLLVALLPVLESLDLVHITLHFPAAMDNLKQLEQDRAPGTVGPKLKRVAIICNPNLNTRSACQFSTLNILSSLPAVTSIFIEGMDDMTPPYVAAVRPSLPSRLAHLTMRRCYSSCLTSHQFFRSLRSLQTLTWQAPELPLARVPGPPETEAYYLTASLEVSCANTLRELTILMPLTPPHRSSEASFIADNIEHFTRLEVLETYDQTLIGTSANGRARIPASLRELRIRCSGHPTDNNQMCYFGILDYLAETVKEKAQRMLGLEKVMLMNRLSVDRLKAAMVFGDRGGLERWRRLVTGCIDNGVGLGGR